MVNPDEDDKITFTQGFQNYLPDNILPQSVTDFINHDIIDKKNGCIYYLSKYAC